MSDSANSLDDQMNFKEMSESDEDAFIRANFPDLYHEDNPSDSLNGISFSDEEEDELVRLAMEEDEEDTSSDMMSLDDVSEDALRAHEQQYQDQPRYQEQPEEAFADSRAAFFDNSESTEDSEYAPAQETAHHAVQESFFDNSGASGESPVAEREFEQPAPAPEQFTSSAPQQRYENAPQQYNENQYAAPAAETSPVVEEQQYTAPAPAVSDPLGISTALKSEEGRIEEAARIIRIADTFRNGPHKEMVMNFVYDSPEHPDDVASLTVKVMNVNPMLETTMKNIISSTQEKDRVERVFQILNLPDNQLVALGRTVGRITNDPGIVLDGNVIPDKNRFVKELEASINKLDSNIVEFVQATENVLRAAKG